MANAHLVILKKPYLNDILAGRKTVESRLTRTRRSPLGEIAKGDKLFFKITSGPVCAIGRVKKVMQFENLTPSRIKRIEQEYNDRILGTDLYWTEKRQSRYCVLIWLENIKNIPPRLINKKDWRAWVVLTSQNNFDLLRNR